MTYKENVQRIAEEMATDRHKRKMEPVSGALYGREFMYPRWEELSTDDVAALSSMRHNEARIAVAHMAEELKGYFNEQVLPGVHADMKGWAIIQFEEYLNERGLVPAQEGAQDDI